MAARPSFLISCLRRRLLLLSGAVLLGLLSSQRISADNNNILYSGDCLYPGQYLYYGNYWLVMQEDCNLVLYDSGRSVWSSGTDGRGSYCYVRMQSDGNLVVYSNSGQALWASNTDRPGNGYYALILQDDRNVVIYGGGAIWATASNGYGGAAGVVVNGGLAAGRNETSQTSTFGSVAAAVVNAAGGGTVLELGRKIRMATAKGLHG